MKTEEQIRQRLNSILSDDRLRDATATVFENAPLALIQMGLEAARDELRWVLDPDGE